MMNRETMVIVFREIQALAEVTDGDAYSVLVELEARLQELEEKANKKMVDDLLKRQQICCEANHCGCGETTCCYCKKEL